MSSRKKKIRVCPNCGKKFTKIMFAKKYIAKDGDKCDSLAEKIIDKNLSKRLISY